MTMMNRFRSKSQSFPLLSGLSPSSSSKALHNGDEEVNRLQEDLVCTRTQHKDLEVENKKLAKELVDAQHTNATLSDKVVGLEAQLSESRGGALRLQGELDALREVTTGQQALRELERRMLTQENSMAEVRFELWPHEFGAQQHQAPQQYQQPATSAQPRPPPTELSFNTSAGVALSGSTQEAATPPLRFYTTTTTSSPMTTPRPFLPFGAFNSDASSDFTALTTPRPAQLPTTMPNASSTSLPITTSGPAHQTTPTVLAPCDFASSSVVATAGPSLAVIPATPTAANFPLSSRPLSTIQEADTPASGLSPALSQTQNSASTRSRPASRDSSTGSQSQSQSQPQSQRQSIISATGTFGQGHQTGLGLSMPTTPEVAPAQGSDGSASTGEEEGAEAGVEGEDVPLALDGEPGFDDEAVAPSDATAGAAAATGEGEESHL